MSKSRRVDIEIEYANMSVENEEMVGKRTHGRRSRWGANKEKEQGEEKTDMGTMKWCKIARGKDGDMVVVGWWRGKGN